MTARIAANGNPQGAAVFRTDPTIFRDVLKLVNTIDQHDTASADPDINTAIRDLKRRIPEEFHDAQEDNGDDISDILDETDVRAFVDAANSVGEANDPVKLHQQMAQAFQTVTRRKRNIAKGPYS